jgi:hypothetical protein
MRSDDLFLFWSLLVRTEHKMDGRKDGWMMDDWQVVCFYVRVVQNSTWSSLSRENMSSLPKNSAVWRQLGLSYLQYLGVCNKSLRGVLKVRIDCLMLYMNYLLCS